MSSGNGGRVLMRLLLFLSVCGSNSSISTTSAPGMVAAIATAARVQSATTREPSVAKFARKATTIWSTNSSINFVKGFPSPRVCTVVRLPSAIPLHCSFPSFPGLFLF